MPLLCCSVLGLARLCLRAAAPIVSYPRLSIAFRCLALPLLDFSLHPIAVAKLCSSFPSHFFTEHRLRTSISSLPLLRSASLFPCNSQLFIAFAYRGCAKPSHIKAPDCIAKAIASRCDSLPLLGSSIQGLCCSNQCETQPLQVISLLFVSTPRQISARLNKAVAKLRKSLPSPLVAVPFRCTSFMCSAVANLITVIQCLCITSHRESAPCYSVAAQHDSSPWLVNAKRRLCISHQRHAFAHRCTAERCIATAAQSHTTP